MHPDSYTALTSALNAIDLTGQQMRPDQLVVSAQRGPVWPDRGNSFWLSHQNGTWYLSTWSPVCYRIPAGQDVVAVAHGGTIRAAIAHALGLGPGGGLAFSIENCSVTRLDYITFGAQCGWRIGMVNHQPWLSPSQHPTMHQPAGPEIVKLA